MRLTTKKINDSVKHLGFGLCKVLEGSYFYWYRLEGEDGKNGGTLIEEIVSCVSRLNDMTLEEWIKDLENKIKDSKEEEFHSFEDANTNQ